MRRWHAILVAAITAVLVGTALISIHEPVVEAGTSPFSLSVDCDTSTGGIQSSCTPPSGTTSLDVDVILGNTGSATTIGAAQFAVRVTPQTAFDPPAVADATGFNSNPDWADLSGTWNCSTAGTDNDTNPDANIADSFLGCFISSGVGPVLAGGNTLLGTVSYVTTDAEGTFLLVQVEIGDNDGVPLVVCDESGSVTGTCNGATVNIGASAPPTATPTATATAVPCQVDCPTNTAVATGTSLSYDTVTPTPGGETATPVPPAGESPTTGGGPGAAPTTAGGGPGGVISGPDTGTGDGTIGGMDMTALSLMLLLALGAGGLAGGAYLVLAGVRARQGRDG